MIEFISTQLTYGKMFQQHSVNEMIEKYQANNIAESIHVHELYLQPFTLECVQCGALLKPMYSHRSKTVMSFTRTYKAHECRCHVCQLYIIHIYILIYIDIVIGTCFCETCDIEFFPNFYIQRKKKFVTFESIKNDRLIYLNGNQIFDQYLLIDFDQQLIHSTLPFEGYTNAYNSKIKLISKRQNQPILSTSSGNSIM